MIAVIVKKNPHLPPGTWVEHFDGGWQKAITITDANHRMQVISHEGIIYPDGTLEPFMMRPKKRGLDK